MATIPVEEKVLATEDFYEILGISKKSEDKEIVRAYRKLALKLHPDRNNSPKAVPAFQKLERIHTALRDPKKRGLYDEKGVKGLDDYESRGEQGGDFEFTKFAKAVITSGFFFTFYPCKEKRSRNFNAGPVGPKEEAAMKKADFTIMSVTFLLILLGGLLSMVDTDQRSAVLSFERDEGRRYIFEETTTTLLSPRGKNKKSEGEGGGSKKARVRSSRSSSSFAAQGSTAASVKYHMRWKRSSLGDTTSDALGASVVQPILEEECLGEHRIAEAFVMRRLAASSPKKSALLDGRASFRPRLVRQEPTRDWASWNATQYDSKHRGGVEEEEEESTDPLQLLASSFVTATSPLSLSPQCVPPRMQSKRRKVLRTAS